MKSSLVAALAATAFGLFSLTPASAVVVNIIPVNYTHDVVYEVGATGSGNGTFTNEASALFEAGLATNPGGSGLPSSRILTSAFDGTTFEFGSYTANNAVMVAEGNGLPKFANWDFAPAQQLEYTSLSVLGLSAGGPSNFSMVVFFTDGTNTSNGIENFEGSGRFARGTFDGQVMPDWFANGGTAAGAAASSVGRVDSNDGGGNGTGVNLQQWNFDLTSFVGKSVLRVEFESTGGGGNNRTFLAISGVAIPEPSAFAALAGLSALGLVASRRRGKHA